MKRAIVFLLLMLVLTSTSCARGNWLDRLRYKEVRISSRLLLVNRFTDKVAYLWDNNEWVEPTKPVKATFQALYEAQKVSGN